jgi:hypothetical protein
LLCPNPFLGRDQNLGFASGVRQFENFAAAHFVCNPLLLPMIPPAAVVGGHAQRL